jgi:hypothetical protein
LEGATQPKVPHRETKIRRDRIVRDRLFWLDQRAPIRTMHPLVAFLLNALALYAALGIVTAVAFALFGVTRVQPAPVSLGARVLIVPGAAALWPYVAIRWLKAWRAS